MRARLRGACLFLNGSLDRSPGVERTSEVVALEREEVDVGWEIRVKPSRT